MWNANGNGLSEELMLLVSLQLLLHQCAVGAHGRLC